MAGEPESFIAVVDEAVAADADAADEEFGDAVADGSETQVFIGEAFGFFIKNGIDHDLSDGGHTVGLSIVDFDGARNETFFAVIAIIMGLPLTADDDITDVDGGIDGAGDT